MNFGGTGVHHLHPDSLDHSHFWIVLASMEPPKFKIPFHFEEMWLSDTRCTNTVEAVWSLQVSLDPFILTVHKVEKCGKKLK